ncbi:KRAB-A domain-containing protein 2-like [Myzus persicae]|uniref:KRAB-A domain-containing protein 2-like n=1 Tax=Myzus persicae TaxID=13164 RepID=UPI000B9327F5|nr:KRAB-A domain-containing protein 2-like [Myzus persicae]
MKDYRMVRKYDILTINNKERLIKPVNDDTILYYVTIDELFNILHSTHSTIGHGGRCRMDSELKSKYCNITNETIMAYLNLCTHCQKKSSNPKRGLVSKPILHSTFNSRAQIDLIDMQSQNINGFRFILNYQDHLTKFVLLRALSSKRAEEIAHNMLDIYTTFGAPAILHSDNGREFVNSIINELHSMWPDVKIVHGKPRHSQSQGSVERANRDVEDMLATWMAQNKSKDWPSGLKFIQFQKNRALHSGIGRSHYEAMFGCKARVGLASVGIPIKEICNLNTEADIEKIMIQPENNEDNEIKDDNIENNEIRDEKCLVNKRQENITNERNNSIQCLKKQAERMMTQSNNKYQELEVGTTVRISIPDVDRARGSPRNLLAVIANVDNGFYKLCTENGFLKHKYTRSQLVPCKEISLDLKTLLESSKDKEITLREAAGCSSLMGTQGYQRCHCKMKCKTNKCTCRVVGKLCNSKCHSSLSCENK